MKFKNNKLNNIDRKIFMKSKYFQKLDNQLTFLLAMQHMTI
jgi:hypothetical protein